MEELFGKKIVVQKSDKIIVNADFQQVEFPADTVNRLIHPFRMVLAGPSMSGKSTYIRELIKNREALFTTRFYRIILYVPESSINSHEVYFKSLKQACPNVEIMSGLPKPQEIFAETLPKLIIVDDQMQAMFHDKFMEQIFTAISHHGELSIVFTTQNYFESGPTKTIIRNCNYLVVFYDALNGKAVLRNIGSQLTPQQPQFFNNCFDQLSKYQSIRFSYILVDAHNRSCMDEMKFRTHIFPNEDGIITPLCFFIKPLYKK